MWKTGVLVGLMVVAGTHSGHAATLKQRALAHLTKQPAGKVRLEITKTGKGSFRTTTIRGSHTRLKKIYNKLTGNGKKPVMVHGPGYGDRVIHPVLGNLSITGKGPNRRTKRAIYQVQSVDAESQRGQIKKVVI